MPNLAAIRKAHPNDAPEMAALLNEIIAIGGTTAFENPVSDVFAAAEFIQESHVLCSHVAVDDDGLIAGFQYLTSDARDQDKIGDIATFARRSPVVKGVGTALFHSTQDAARSLGLSKLTAKIRADNTPGLAYYTKMGFVDFDVAKGVPLKDGTPVDRIIKVFDLTL